MIISEQSHSLNKKFQRNYRKGKVIKERKAQSYLVLGENVGLEAMARFLMTAMISKFMYPNISKHDFTHWIEREMGKFLGSIPSWHLLLRSWFCLVFQWNGDLEFFFISSLVLWFILFFIKTLKHSF